MTPDLVSADTTTADSTGVLARFLEEILVITRDQEFGLLHVDTGPFNFYANPHALSLEIHPPWVSVINTKSSAQRTGLGSNTSLYLQIQIQIRCICICIWSNVKSCICFCICIWSTVFGVFHKYVVKYIFSALRESIPMLFNGGGGRTTMTTRCGPACSQVLPVKPQGIWAIGVEAWAGSRDLESGVSEVEVFRALHPNAGHFLNKSLWNTNLHEYSYKHVKECYSFSK